jgi:hypothetical protein
MKRRVTLILSTILIAYTAVGCQRTHNTPPRSSQEESSVSWSSVIAVDVSEIADIVISMCDILGATAEQTSEEAQHLKWNCKFPSDAYLEIEAMPFVKAKSFVKFHLKGENNFAQLLRREIVNARNTAVRNHTH